jgi:hypothetical protein
MASSVTSRGEWGQETGSRRRSPHRSGRLLVTGCLLAAAGVGAAVLAGGDRDGDPPPVGYAEAWIQAWNDRDAQLVSDMTCHYVPVYTAASDVQFHLDRVADGEAVVGDHAVTGTETGTAFGRSGVLVHVDYVRGGEDTVRRKDVFVRVRDDGDMCIGAFAAW